MAKELDISELSKYQYPISDIANFFDLNSSTLRFWEKEFKQLKPHKNSKGIRYYRQNDIEMVYKIYDLVKIKGYTLSGAKEALKAGTLEEEGVDKKVVDELKEELNAIRAKLIDMYLEV